MDQFGEDFEEVADGLDIFCALIGNRNFKAIFECHIDFDHAERIGTEILIEPGFVGQLLASDAEFIGEDLKNDPGILFGQ